MILLIVGCGIDLVKIERIEKVIKKVMCLNLFFFLDTKFGYE
ncbi:unnamed protein product [marine sediment metagenome]|uniref:Uncharacterized protein n=1 Tax=marine sediment metagenome TaxID=412755 RepID=X0Z537_9ZZZZ